MYSQKSIVPKIALVLIAVGLLIYGNSFTVTPLWLFGSWENRIHQVYSIVIWLLLTILIIQRLQNKLNLWIFFFLSLIFLNVFADLVFDHISLIESFLTGSSIRILIGLICYLIAEQQENRNYLALIICGVTLVNVYFAIGGPESYYVFRNVYANTYAISNYSPGNIFVWLENMNAFSTGMYGLQNYPNEFAVLVAASTCLLFNLRSSSWRSNIFLFIFILGIILSKNRMALVGIIFCLAIMAFLFFKRQRIKLKPNFKKTIFIINILVLIVIILGLLFSLGIMNLSDTYSVSKLFDRLSLDPVETGITIRLESYQTVINLIINNPFGVGEEAMRENAYDNDVIAVTHNMLLRSAARYGILFSILIIFLIIEAIRRLIKNIRNNLGFDDNKFGAPQFLGALIVILIIGLVHPIDQLWLPWVLIGTGAATRISLDIN